MKLASVMVLSACALGAFSGCSVSVEPIGEPGPPAIVVPTGAGSMTLNWLVAGSTNPAVCSQFGASQMEIVVYDASGRPVTRMTEPCGNFTASIALPEGTYTADATLLDAAGRAVSTTKTLEAINVIADTGLTINLDFPSDSIR
jgi:hypothetical protein